MKLQIRERDQPLTKRLREHIERRVGFALARFGERVVRVMVRFSDGKGRPGKGKLCEIEVTLRPQTVRVEDRDPDAFAAVDHVAARVSRSIARALAEQPSSSTRR